jgi:magnesium chelatase subunit D
LSEAYKHRDKIALITVQGITADVTLPPTRSVALAKRRLDSMPCGGGSPLAHAILQGTRLGLNAMKVSDVVVHKLTMTD